ncbi:ABC transporter substrate-binding protein [Pedobacter alpinus]|uniref:histidine kinase n=1 Tax=Pedobacter alpinus TaxID=1590643 RepID=A0ABW5TNL8_9SPHI
MNKCFANNNKEIIPLAIRYSLFLVFLFFISLHAFSKDVKEKPIKLQLKWRNQFQFAGYYAAKIKGFYKENQLNVEIKPGGNGIFPVEEVKKGNADIGIFDPGILLKNNAKQPLVVLATIMQSSGYCIISLKEKKILKPSDLIGKKILAEEGQGWTIFKAILLKEGLDTNKVQIIKRKKDSEEILDNEADAVVTYATSQPQRLTALGYQLNILRPEEYGVDFYGDVIFTTSKFAYKDIEKTNAFIKASIKGWKYALTHQKELIDYILTLPDVVKYGTTRKDLEIEAKEISKLIMPEYVEVGHTNIGRWQYMLNLYQKLGLASKNVTLKNFIYDDEELQINKWILPVVYVVFFVLIIIVSIIFINWQLRNRVRIKTKELQNEIDSRKLAENFANESRQQIELILESSNIGLWELDLITNKKTFNLQFKTILGFPNDFNFLEEDFFERIHPEDLVNVQPLFEILDSAMSLKRMISFRIEKATGEYINVLSSSKILFQNGVQSKISGVLLDIEDIKRKENEIIKVSEELMRRNNELKKFAYITSHNLRGPVVNLSSLYGMIDKESLDKENNLFIDKIGISITKLENTLNDLIEVVSQEKAENLKIAPININDCFQSVLQSIENQIIESGVSFTFNLGVKEISYPKHYFESIILNLITNAIKYRAEDRKLEVIVETFETDDFVGLKLNDNGIGIDLKKNKSKIFGLYQRFNPEIQGKGIGLFIIKSHIESLNGKIEVESELGKGSTFNIYFRKALNF